MQDALFFNEDFYRRIAHLFYAFAAADRQIRVEEKKSIVKAVEKDWDFHTDSFDSKEVIYSTLRKLIEGQLDKDLAFGSFVEYYKEHHKAFSEELKITILNSANSIIRSFSGVNKSELTIYSQLHLLFNEQQ